MSCSHDQQGSFSRRACIGGAPPHELPSSPGDSFRVSSAAVGSSSSSSGRWGSSARARATPPRPPAAWSPLLQLTRRAGRTNDAGLAAGDVRPSTRGRPLRRFCLEFPRGGPPGRAGVIYPKSPAPPICCCARSVHVPRRLSIAPTRRMFWKVRANTEEPYWVITSRRPRA